MTDVTTRAGRRARGRRRRRASARRPFWQRLVSGSSTWIGLILVGLIVVFSLLDSSAFVSSANSRNIATDAAVLLVLATGMTYVIITAGIDLSVGGVLVFGGVVVGQGDERRGRQQLGRHHPRPRRRAGRRHGVGALQRVPRGQGRRSPRSSSRSARSACPSARRYVITGGVDEREVPFKLITTIGTGRAFNEIPWLVVIAFAVALVFGIILAGTRFGRYTYAVGSNEEAARRAGIGVDCHLMKVYGLVGTLAGLAGFLSLARFSTTTIGGHDTDNLQAIAAVVIGGTSLFGGIGTMLGTVFGVFIPAVLANGFIIVGVQAFWQQIAVGAVLIGAVYLDQLRRRSQDRR